MQIPEPIRYMRKNEAGAITCLDFSGMPLTQIPEWVFECSALEYLNLSNTSISHIPNALGRCTAIKYLILRNTAIECLPNCLDHFQALRTLDLRNTLVGNLPGSFFKLLQNPGFIHFWMEHRDTNRIERDKYGNVITLDLGRYNFNYWVPRSTQKQQLPEEIGGLTQLKTLSLKQSDYDALPASIGKCEELETLDLRLTTIKQLPEELGNCRSLTTVFLDSYWLERLPNSFIKVLQSAHFKRLYWNDLGDFNAISKNSRNQVISLTLRGKHCTYLPDWIQELTELTTLDIQTTNISVIPEWIQHLTKLEVLNLASTNISVIPEEIGKCVSLKILDLYGLKNLILPETMDQLMNLTTLILIGTQIRSYSNSFFSLLNLPKFKHVYWFSIEEEFFDPVVRDRAGQIVELNFYEVRLDFFPLWISKCKGLQKVDFHDNHFDSFPETFFDLLVSPNLKAVIWENENCVEKDDEGQIIGLTLWMPEIKAFQNWLLQCKTLRKLRLHLQDSEVTPEWLGQLDGVEHLDLSYSRIRTLPEWIMNWSHLSSLDLSDSWITSIPEWIGKCDRLQQLRLNGSKIPLALQDFLLSPDGIAQYCNYPSIIIEKILKNRELDECDQAYPFYSKYRDVFKKICEENPTQTARDVSILLDRIEQATLQDLNIVL